MTRLRLGDTEVARIGLRTERRGATQAQVALAWLLERSPAILPIPRSLAIEHVKENLAAPDLELSEAEFDALL